MKKNFQKKEDMLFWIIALVLLLFLVLYAFSGIRFLAKSMNNILGEEVQEESLIVDFDFDTLESVLEEKLP